MTFQLIESVSKKIYACQRLENTVIDWFAGARFDNQGKGFALIKIKADVVDNRVFVVEGDAEMFYRKRRLFISLFVHILSVTNLYNNDIKHVVFNLKNNSMVAYSNPI